MIFSLGTIGVHVVHRLCKVVQLLLILMNVRPFCLFSKNCFVESSLYNSKI